MADLVAAVEVLAALAVLEEAILVEAEPAAHGSKQRLISIDGTKFSFAGEICGIPQKYDIKT